MELNAVVAIVRADRLQQVEQALAAIGVEGLSVSKVKGYGEYHNFFTQDHMASNVRIEIFAALEAVSAIRDAIIKTAYTGEPGDGIVVVFPVSQLHRIRA